MEESNLGLEIVGSTRRVPSDSLPSFRKRKQVYKTKQKVVVRLLTITPLPSRKVKFGILLIQGCLLFVRVARFFPPLLRPIISKTRGN